MKQTYPSVYFAFLDILGFKDIVLNKEHAALERLYLNLVPTSIDLALAGGRFTVLDRGGEKLAVPDTQRASVNSLLVSDSIMMWTENDSMKAFIDILAAVRNLMSLSQFSGLPLRGAISIGPVTILTNQSPSSKSIFQHSLFGKPIVEAALAEKVQQWSGCLIAQAAIDRYRGGYVTRLDNPADLATLEFLIESKFLLRYPVPKRNSDGSLCAVEEYVVDWVNATKSPVQASSVIKALSMHGKSVTDPASKRKLENTVNFVRHVNPAADLEIAENAIQAP